MPHFANVTGLEQAIEIQNEHRSPRFRLLDELESYVSTTAYDNRPDFFTAADVPLWDRKPCIAVPVVRSAITSNVDLCLGEGQFPAIQLEKSPEDAGEENPVDQLIREMVKQARFRRVIREAFASAQGSKTACVIYGVRRGRLFADTVKAKWCEPEFDPSTEEVTRLVIQYPYHQLERDPQQRGKYRAVPMLYRRVIDRQRDTTYKPVPLCKGEDPAFSTDRAKTYDHNLGWCPVIWYRHMPGCSVAGDIDGVAIHQDSLDEIFAFDLALSQKHRAALFAGDPQWTEIGVADDDLGVADGHQPQRMGHPASLMGGEPAAQATSQYLGGPGPARKARRKSPGEVWQYANPNAKVEMHTMPGDGLTALANHIDDLRVKLSEALCHVHLDPANLKHAASFSGKALETLMQRQLSRCDQYRDDMAEGLIIPLMSGLLRVLTIVPVRGLRSLPEALPRLLQVMAETENEPPLELLWGPYFRPDAADDSKVVDLVVKGRQEGLVTLRRAVQRIASIFDVSDIDQELAELDAERQDEEVRLIARDRAMHGSIPEGDDQEDEPIPDAADTDDPDDTQPSGAAPGRG